MSAGRESVQLRNNGGLALKKERREFLTVLTAAAGSALLPGFSAAAEQAPAADHPARETALGIGGFFFRARDPRALEQWYQDHLGIPVSPQKLDDPVWNQEAGETLFTAFSETSKYFGDETRQWMLNLRVRNLDRMAAQLEAAGITVKIDPNTYPNGRFARLHDPEGNPIELWQPMTAPAK